MNLMLRNRNLALEDLASFSRFFDLGFDGMGLFDQALAPTVDLVETPDGYTLSVDLPGVDRKDLELSVENNVLSLKGEKKDAKAPTRYFRRETWSGAFRRTISLPAAADSGKVEAKLEDGVLTVTIGKREELKPRTIAVTVQ